MPAHRLRLWLPVVAWAGVIFWFSNIPDLSTGLGGWDTLIRKTLHVAEYAVLGLLLDRATGSWRLALVLAVAYAASDEVHQLFVEGRHGRPLDVLIDTCGVLLGIAARRRWARARPAVP